MKPDDYKKLMNKSVTANYEKTEVDTEQKINVKAQSLTETLKISDRVEPFTKKPGYFFQ